MFEPSQKLFIPCQGSHLAAHPLFEPLSEDELAADPCVELIKHATEEGQKVARNNGKVVAFTLMFASQFRSTKAR